MYLGKPEQIGGVRRRRLGQCIMVMEFSREVVFGVRLGGVGGASAASVDKSEAWWGAEAPAPRQIRIYKGAEPVARTQGQIC